MRRFNWFKKHANQQAGLVLLASIPCLLVALVALFWSGLSGYLVAFIIILLSLLVTYAAFAGKLKADYQLQTLANLIEAMIDGDYSLRGRRQSNPAFQDLLELVNRLANSLHKHKLQAEESQLLIEKLIGQMDAMFFAVDAHGFVAMLNSSAKQLLPEAGEKHKNLTLSDLNLSVLENLEESGVVELKTARLNGEYFIIKDRFINNNEPHELYLVTQADRLLREKERQAWQNLLRVISHELNNSLAPIATFSRTMLKQIDTQGDAVNLTDFGKGLLIIKERAESLHQFIASYSQLTHLHKARKKQINWQETLSNYVSLQEGCRIINHLDKRSIDKFVSADPAQLEQVFINLLKNAREAMMEKIEKVIELDAQSSDNWLHISIKDSGTGITNPENLFVPLYTTKENGNGIGLTLSQQILMNHGGRLTLKNRQDGQGAEAIITLPLSASVNA